MNLISQKKFACLLITLTLSSFSGRVLAQGKNFIQDEIIKIPGITTDDQTYALDPYAKQTTITYNDGLGRPIQTVAVQASPSRKDIIQPLIYNNLGQQNTNLLPYVGADGGGSFRANAANDQMAFYSNGTADKVTDDTSPFSQKVFENSPLQRILSSGFVGAGYQPAGATGTQHYKTIIYRANVGTKDGNVILWDASGINQGNYADNALSVTDLTDEDGRENLIFSTRSGQVVLKRQKNGTLNIDTYYIYNNAGNISYVIPPVALKKMVSLSNYDPNQTALSALIFKYIYDARGRLVQKRIPGSGDVYIIYDPLNRPVLVQDGNLRKLNQWNYIKYDSKNHPISQGIYVDNTPANIGQANMQVFVSGIAAYNTTWYESRSTSASNGYYTNSVFPTSTSAITPLAYCYFDDYDIDGNGTANYAYSLQYINNEPAVIAANIKGVPTIIRTRTVGSGLTNIWLVKALFYDKYGHLIQTQSNNQLNFTDGVITDYSTSGLDFTGVAVQTKVLKVTGTGTTNTNTVLTSMSYDHMHRISAIDQTYNNSGAVIHIASYNYNELGQLVKKNLQPGSNQAAANVTLDGSNSINSGGTLNVVATNQIILTPNFSAVAGSAFSAVITPNALQSIDFRYNIRGQLTSINNSKLNDDSGTLNTNDNSNDLLGMQFLYDQIDGNLGNTPWFNGKLSAVKWMTRDVNGVLTNERSYKYNYDAVDRYSASTYAERSPTATAAFNINPNGFDEYNISYDDGGNISGLKRNASTIGASTPPVEFDNLTYGYDSNNPNQLKTVTDGTGSNYTGYGFRNISGTTTGTYIYDPASGNLTTDPYKSLIIAYNILNRTDKITLTSGTGQYINYTYNAAGQLIRKQQYNNSVIQTSTDYIDGFVYINGVISYFGMPEGRVRNTATGSAVTLKTEYIINDQQGNARISFEESSTMPGLAIVKQENSYYGFGLVMPGSPVTTPVSDNKLLYNGGSEWQKDYGNLPDYYQTFYRNYDAALGRFIGVDPKAELSESLTIYQYGQNNPIVYNDPLGDYQQAGGGLDPFRDAYEGDLGGGGSGGAGGPSDFSAYNQLITEARNGSTIALLELGQRYGTTFYGNDAKAAFKALTANYRIYTIVNGKIISTANVSGASKDQYRLGYASDPVNAPNTYDKYVNLTDQDANSLLGRNADDQQRESIDWGGATNAFFGMVGGIAEVAVGALTIESGVGIFAVGDGGTRAILNGMRLYGYLSGRKNDSDVTPSNMGALVGKIIDNDFGHVDANKAGRFQTAFGIANDAATMALTHTNWSSPAVDATSAVAGAFSDSYTLGYYYNYFVNPH